MNTTTAKTAIILGAAFAVLYPLWVWLTSITFPLSSPFILIAQAWGLLAFTLMWLHIVAGPFKQRLLSIFPKFELWMTLSSFIVLLSIILHPLLMLVGISKLIGIVEFFATASMPIWLAIIAWFMFISYDIARIFKKRLLKTRTWFVITLIATLGWFLILYHSLSLGSHLQEGLLRMLWYFFGATGTAAAITTYGIKPFLKR